MVHETLYVLHVDSSFQVRVSVAACKFLGLIKFLLCRYKRDNHLDLGKISFVCLIFNLCKRLAFGCVSKLRHSPSWIKCMQCTYV